MKNGMQTQGERIHAVVYAVHHHGEVINAAYEHKIQQAAKAYGGGDGQAQNQEDGQEEADD
jgi:polysaccharide pyruvyl transferase WcaK-like protein